MSELPPYPPLQDNSATDNSSLDMQSLRDNESSLSRNLFRPRYLWKHNRWLFLAYLSAISILLLGVSLLLLYLYFQIANSRSEDMSRQDKLDTEHKSISTHNSDDNAFFAEQPLTILYYSFAQTTNNRHVYQATPNDNENRIIDVGYPDKYKFSTSPNGSWFIRWNEVTVEKSSAANPQKFDPIFTVSEKGHTINSVIWQSDEASIAIATSREGDAETGMRQNLVTILPLVTLQAVNVYEATQNFNVELVSFPNTNSIYFIENNNGSKRNLALYNIQSRSIVKQFSTFNQNNLLNELQFSSDMKSAIHHTDTQVIRYNLDSMEQSVVYSTDRMCEVGEPNSSTNSWTTLSPSGSMLLIHEKLFQCTHRSRSSSPTPVPHTSQTTLYSLKDNKVLERKYNLELPGLLTSLWSPKEDKVWLSFDSQQAYIASTSDLNLNPIPSPQRQAITLERVFSIGWLQIKK